MHNLVSMTTYYQYDDYHPSAIVNPYEDHWEDIENWPRVYKYLPAHELSQQGLHPPAPIFQAGQGFNNGMYPYGMAVSQLTISQSLAQHTDYICDRLVHPTVTAAPVILAQQHLVGPTTLLPHTTSLTPIPSIPTSRPITHNTIQ